MTQAEKAISNDLLKQRDFISKLSKKGFDFGIVVSEAFVRGMRDLGYKSTGTAIDELIDNSLQAEASSTHIVFGYNENNQHKKKPNMIAIIDDGHGMDPEMIRISAIWGGTHRENDRNGFGRYGYGLPSASVSIGKQFKVISKVIDGDWYEVKVDIDEIGEGKYLNENGKVEIPEAKKTKLPIWIKEYIEKSFPDLKHGTVVLIDKIDRLDYKTTKALKDFLLQHCGLTYRNYLRTFKIVIDDAKVEGIDPLFSVPSMRYYDEDDERAKAFPEMKIEIKDKSTKETLGIIKARFSYMPVTFLRIPEDKMKIKGGKNNNRFKIRKENNGIIVCRAGRQIDVINSKCPWTTFQNNDRYIGVEIDFPPSLDEEFSMTTSKQQITIKERIWDILKENGVYRFIQEFREQYKKDRMELEDKIKKGSQPEQIYPAEDAMAESKKFHTHKPETPKQQEEKKENLEKEAKKRAENQGRKPEDVQKELESEVEKTPYKIYEVDAGGGAHFYWAKQLGGQLALYLNINHRFFKDIYNAEKISANTKEALKVFLYALAESELSASEEIKRFYDAEKFEWTKRLDSALASLEKWQLNEDDNSFNDEINESE